MHSTADMEVTSIPSTMQDKRFSRYRSVRKAASREDTQQPPIPDLPSIPSPPSGHSQLAQCPPARVPSRYHRKIAPTASDSVTAPAPSKDPVVVGAGRTQSRYRTNRPQAVPEIQDKQNEASSKLVQLPETEEVSIPPPVDERPRKMTGPSTSERRMTRYRSKTTSTPQQKRISPRGSYDAAREEARAILEGETGRLARLKEQQEKAEKERKQRAERKAAALKAEQARAEQAKSQEIGELDQTIASPPLPQAPVPVSTQQRLRKWTIGGSSQSSPPVTAPSSPPSADPNQPSLSRKVSRIVRRHKPEETITESPPVLPSAGFVDQPLPKKAERRPTTSRPRGSPKARTYEPKAGDGPPKTAIAAPQTVDAPLSAVNAGDRRVEVRFEKSKITLPVTPSTTARELLNSASIILSQPIDPRTSVLIETYYPLGLERPLRKYERIRDVMNSWDSVTQNHLIILPESECDAKGLDQKEAPEAQPSHTMLNLHHSQKPGKWDKHWMILKEDGQVTSSKIENDGNATNAFHLSDFDVYMPTKKEIRKIKPPKRICFAIKSQQRSIVFESTENFVHYFSTNDKSAADEWYNAVQAWRSWYLVNILNQGGAPKPPPTSAAPVGTMGLQRRPSTAHSRDSIPYQLGTFEPLLEFSVDAFKYGEDAEGSKPAQPQKPASPKRPKALVDHARSNSNTEGTTSVLQRKGTTRKRTPPDLRRTGGLIDESKNEIREGMSGPGLGSTEEGFTGKGLLARAFSVRKAQAEENAAIYDNTDNAFTGKGLLARKMSTKRFVNENLVVAENTNDAFTGGGLLARKASTKKFVNENIVVPENTNDAFMGGGLVSRSVTKKRSQASRPGQPLVDLAATSEFVDRSLLRNVEAYEISQGQHLPVIDRSRTTEINSKTGEV